LASKGRKVSGGTFWDRDAAEKESEFESAFSASKTGPKVENSAKFEEFVFFKKEKRSVFSENAV
jgi:hypothetical protein